jgi:histidinol dehydrogenase
MELIKKEDEAHWRQRLEIIKSRDVGFDSALMATVSEMIDEVRRHGDAALIDYTSRFDGVSLTRDRLRVTREELERAAQGVSPEVLAALKEAIRRIRNFHSRQLESSWDLETVSEGTRLGQRITPIDCAGLYVPGGSASYPSSVIMNAIPAQVAGVERIVVVTPPRTLSENPAVAATLLELGLTEIYRVGGAQAVAALAYGTETLPRVDKITGPGNRFVAAAKRLVFGAVGIDSIAGPSEVVIIADQNARADFVAADMLAQAEHSEDAASILITDSEALARAVSTEIDKQLGTLPRVDIATHSLNRYGAIFVTCNLEKACHLANEIAPEHLEIIADDDERLSSLIKHAGAIFLGPFTPEAVGDYFAGPNHVLPTGGAVRYASALGVYDFLRRTSVLRYSQAEINSTANMIAAIANAEGLDAHARSAMIRINSIEDKRDSGA